MKTSLTTILSFLLALSLNGQTKTDFKDMDTHEIRKFLLEQNESEPAKNMLKKHNTSRITAYSLLAGSLVFAIASGESSGDPGLQSGTVVTGLVAGLLFVGAGLAGITASERMKKAKSIYLTGSTSVNSNRKTPIIRNEREVMNSIFKYPTPR